MDRCDGGSAGRVSPSDGRGDGASPNDPDGPLARLAHRLRCGGLAGRLGWGKADLLVVVVLTVVSVLVRWPARPLDGLYHDDAWVAIGAMRSGLGSLPATSTDHPGHTVILMAWSRMSGVGPEALVWPILIAGSLLAPALYLLLTRWTRRAGAVVLASAAAVAIVHVDFSARAKTYAVDPLVILAIAAALPRVTKRRWSWRYAVGWLVVAGIVGTYSVFAAVAFAVAAVIVVLHPQGDRRVRIVTVGVQGLAQLAYLTWVRSSFNTSRLGNDWDVMYDGYARVGGSPTASVADFARHLGRAVSVFPGGTGWPAVALGLVVLFGLAHAARGGRNVLVARFLGMMLALAIIGSYLEIIPFGPSNSGALTGGRAGLWLIPSLAFGLAEAVRVGLSAWPTDRSIGGLVSLAVALVVAGSIIASTYSDAAPYPAPGAGSAARFVDGERAHGASVVLTSTALYPFFASSTTPISIQPTPDGVIGFVPQSLDHQVAVANQPLRTIKAIDGADEVVVYEAVAGFADVELKRLSTTLTEEGLRPAGDRRFGWARVQIWRRPR